jgi:hypothetical protein
MKTNVKGKCTRSLITASLVGASALLFGCSSTEQGAGYGAAGGAAIGGALGGWEGAAIGAGAGALGGAVVGGVVGDDDRDRYGEHAYYDSYRDQYYFYDEDGYRVYYDDDV